MDDYDWNALAEEAEAGQLAPIEATTLRGTDAAVEGRRLLLAATGANSIKEATRIALGRPRLDAASDESVTWKVRASTRLDTVVDEIAKREGRTRSALIRDAVAEYARTHQAV